MSNNTQNFKQSFAALSFRRKLFVVLIIVGAISFMIVAPFIGILENDTGENRTEDDYITRDYVVKNIWERWLVVKNRRTDEKKIQQHYDFIELEGENFNLSLPIKLYEEDNYSQYISAGDTVEVKVYAPELAEMESSNIWNSLIRFIENDNREVEVFELKIKGQFIFDKDINRSDVNFRKGVTLVGTNLIIVIIVGGIVVMIIYSAINRIRVKTRKKV